MKKVKRKMLMAALGIAALSAFGAVGLLTMQTEKSVVYAATSETEETGQYQILKDTENVAATYSYTALNETECSVKITNKADATKAIIPSTADINGKTYKVTEIATNGFASSTKLLRVSLPSTLKKVGNNAFANCSKLSSVNLANVKEIGNGAFSRCTELAEIMIPKSVEKVGTYVFRNNNTQVRIRAAEADCVAWSPSWKTYNENQAEQYESDYVQPLVLEEMYNTMARSVTPEVIGYAFAGGQPRSEEFYQVNTDNGIQTYSEEGDDLEIGSEDDDAVSNENNNIFIPATYNGKDILSISSYAFSFSTFNQLIVESSETGKHIAIGYNAFENTTGDSIVINRPVDFYDYSSGEVAYDVFYESTVKSIALPNNITAIEDQMFYGCAELSNIYFIEPTHITDRTEMLGIINSLSSPETEGIVRLPGGSNVTSIGQEAFVGTTSIKELYLGDGITKVGSNVLSGWDSETQTVYVDITDESEDWDKNWAKDWTGGFDNVKQAYYTIKFDFNGGESDTTFKKVKYNEAIGDLPIPERPHCDFDGWKCLEDNKTYSAETVYPYEKDITLTAQWKDTEYKIIFNDMGGEGGSGSKTLKYGELMPRVNVPTKEGYIFKGYFSELGDPYYFDDGTSGTRWQIEDREITLYAKWEGKPCNIIFDNRGGIGGGSVYLIKYGESLPLLAPIEKEGYAFGGYYSDISWSTPYYDKDMKPVVETWDIAQSQVYLYAKWDKKSITIQLDNQNGTENSKIEVVYDEYIKERKELKPTKEGYIFKGFYENKSSTFTGAMYFDDEMNGCGKWTRDEESIVIYAHWQNASYTVTLNSCGSSSYIAREIPVTYDEKMTPGYEPPKKNGYEFGGYYDAEEGGTQYYNSGMGSAHNWDKVIKEGDEKPVLYAHWIPIEYKINFDTRGGEGGSLETRVNYNEKLSEIELPTRTGYEFDGYYFGEDEYYDMDEKGCKEWRLSEFKEYTLYAKWNPIESNLIFVKEENDKIVRPIKYDDEMPDMTVPTRDGYVFKGYYSKPNGKGDQYYDKDAYKIVLIYKEEKDTTLYAYWVYEEYEITYHIIGEHSEWTRPKNDLNPAKYTIKDVKDKNLDLKVTVYNGYKIEWQPSYIEANSIGPKIVSGTWKKIETTIKYDLNGGVNNKDNPTIVNYKEVTLKDARRKGYFFDGWTLNGNVVTKIPQTTEDSITLVAKWVSMKDGKAVGFSASSTAITVSGSSYMYITLTEAFTSSCTFNVASSVKQLYVYSDSSTRLHKMNINILGRTTNFTLILENVNMQAEYDKEIVTSTSIWGTTQQIKNKGLASAINMVYGYTNSYLHMYTYGTVNIKGANGIDGQDGKSAITCQNLIIHCADNLFIEGGNGSQSGNRTGSAAVAIYVDMSFARCRNNVTMRGGYVADGSTFVDNFYINSGYKAEIID